jgi:exodeoxyribonuclease VII large subunit
VSGSLSQAVWSVASLLRELSQVFVTRFSLCAVRGEISGFTRAGSGHCYFNLKDADGDGALIRCAMFKRCANLLDFIPANGQLIELRGRLSVYEPRGELQLVVEIMQRAGAGALFEQYMRLKARLEAQGWFANHRKRSLPARPRCVGVVTSLDAAALQDVLTTLARRSPHVRVVVYPSLVQGAQAPRALCEAIELAVKRAEIDVLIMCRGGGSLEDLWAYNDERVVLAIARATMPVVCGVGHETDLTLCDWVADVRAPTPTAAAELVTAMSTQMQLDNLFSTADRLMRAAQQNWGTQAQRLDRVSLRLTRPVQRLHSLQERLNLLAQRMSMGAGYNLQLRHNTLVRMQSRLSRAAHALLRQRRHPLMTTEARLRGVDPRNILKRGYAWLTRSSGQPVTSLRALTVGDSLHAVLNDGAATVLVARLDPPPLGLS